MTAATLYSGTAKDVLHQLKFERAGAAAEGIAALVACGLCASDFTCVTYVPTAPARVRSRGYDQARLIARAVARRLGLPCYSLLARSGNQRQLGQSRTVRQEQMRQAFYTRRGYAVQNQELLLIDDVLTTGSSCEAAARVLLDAGAARVHAAVFAAAEKSATKLAPVIKKPAKAG